MSLILHTIDFGLWFSEDSSKPSHLEKSSTVRDAEWRRLKGVDLELKAYNAAAGPRADTEESGLDNKI